MTLVLSSVIYRVSMWFFWCCYFGSSASRFYTPLLDTVIFYSISFWHNCTIIVKRKYALGHKAIGNWDWWLCHFGCYISQLQWHTSRYLLAFSRQYRFAEGWFIPICGIHLHSWPCSCGSSMLCSRHDKFDTANSSLLVAQLFLVQRPASMPAFTLSLTFGISIWSKILHHYIGRYRLARRHQTTH